MKKNLISVIILALMVVNIVLTAIMMFSVTGTAKKTASLVDNIATALNLELTAKAGDSAIPDVPMENTEVYTIPESMTIPLKDDAVDENGEGGGQHFIMLSIGFSINTKDKGYKTYGSDLSPQETLIKDIIISVFGQYTLEEAKANEAEIKKEILTKVQDLFDSEFIFNVAFSGTMYQ